MRDLMDFCLYILKSIVSTFFNFDLGGYSYGDFLVAVFVVSILVSSLVLSFRRKDASSLTSPTRSQNEAEPGDDAPRWRNGGLIWR